MNHTRNILPGKSLSMQKVLLPGHDPGWNDPPQWVHTGSQSSPGMSTKRVLNKRVAFPLSSAQISNKEVSAQIIPQLPNTPPPPSIQSSVNLTTAVPPPLLPPHNKETVSEITEIEIDKNQALNDALVNLQTVIEKYVLDKNKAEEVKKRLNIMKVMWMENKLNSVIHQKILELSKALQERNIIRADEIHILLMMQHSNLCSTWISGIRSIILELKSEFQNSNTKLSESHSNLMSAEEKGIN